MIKTHPRIAYWLLPAEDDHRRLQAMIDAYADQLGTPRFAPHLTLLAGHADAFGDPQATLDRLAKITAPLSLTTPGTPQWGPTYNQAFLLPFAKAPKLASLVAALHPQNRVPDGYFPHLSLIYADLEKTQGEQLVREYSSGRQTVRFDRLAAIGIGSHCRCAADVTAWEKLATVKLLLKES